MKFEVVLNGKRRVIDLERDSHRWRVTCDGEPLDVDAIEISHNIFSVLLGGKSHEVCVTPLSSGALTLQTARYEFTAEVIDPRAWRGRRHGALEAEGRQQILAPMPGKIVRVLVRAGEKVETGQGLLVVEAMKMQNEIRSPKSGVVGRLLVKEGQLVNAGEVLAWIE